MTVPILIQPLRRKRIYRPISLDITPAIAAGQQLIQSYGGGRFRIAGASYNGSVLVTRETTMAWELSEVADITFESLQSILGETEILVIGCGASISPPPPELRATFRKHRISLEWMDTGAACRTFNILLIEERKAVAALIAVD